MTKAMKPEELDRRKFKRIIKNRTTLMYGSRKVTRGKYLAVKDRWSFNLIQ